MLQIVSGKFFKTDKRHLNNAKSILYSNLLPNSPLRSCLGTLELDGVHIFSQPSGLIYSYINQIEKMGDKIQVGELVRVGDDEIVDSFRCVCVVGLGVYLSRDKDQVDQLCRDRRTATPLLNKCVNLSEEMETTFKALAEKIISLPRKDFEVIDRCLKQFTHALEVIDENIDLAYSMFVYCLEALAQTYFFEPNDWNDYDPSVKEKIDLILKEVSVEVADRIKNTLLEASHNKLKRRFVSFVVSHVNDSFYLNDSPHMGLSPSDLRHTLNNLYDSRSGFVHKLAPVQEQIRHNFWGGDSMNWDNQIYLTLNGLIRLTRHVILQTIHKRPSVDVEEFDWRSALPGFVRMKMSAEYWVANGDSFKVEEAQHRLSGFLQNFEEVVFLGKPILDVRPLLNKIERIFNQGTFEQKRAMYALYALTFVKAKKIPGLDVKDGFLKRNLIFNNQCSIESMLCDLFTYENNTWSAEDCLKCLEQYSKQKYKKDGVVLPRRLLVAVMLYVANRFLRNNNTDEFKKIISNARLELSGSKIIQDRLLLALNSNSPISIYEILIENKAKT